MMVQTEQADCQQVAETDIADSYRVVEGGLRYQAVVIITLLQTEREISNIK